MIDDVKRLAGPFTGAGQSTFPFSFKIFAPTDIYVALAQEENGVSTTLSYGTDYTVSMNEDQDGTPGGSVTLTTALTGTQVVAIGSGIPYTQELNLTNYSRFAPESINTELDREVVQIQQLAELVGRAITTDPTDTMTPQELKDNLLSAQKDAREQANLAAESAAAAKASEEKTAEYAEAATVILPFREEIAVVAKDIDSVVTTAGSIDNVNTVADHIVNVDNVGGSIEAVDAVSTLAPHLDDLTSIGGHINEVHKVGQDLMGVNAGSLDLGYVTGDPDTITKVVDGYIKKVAEHIDDCVHPVAMSLDSVKAVAENLEPVNQVAEIMHVDYESIFLNGLPEGD